MVQERHRYGECLLYRVDRGPSTILKPAFLDSFRPHRGNVVPLYNGGAKLECEAPNHQPNISGPNQFVDMRSIK
ncbi:hypothetical protein NECAME_04214 [Necator americanus]|uniref:Uncharacterized protein n=1 Tax=Necator americanus TaxID=51031 RepID=W2SYV1_NECAM|nr:hypothetical protein NECAME_04214 [Necator americanus]ETN73822.1 hypothetical protein NECAME_04214 [Necator americanus]